MPDAALTNSAILNAYLDKTPGSRRLAEEARDIFPSGIVHDSRKFEPYGIYVTHAKGARTWDVDGNEYVDYTGGHGALILGHGRREVLEAVHRQLDRVTHPGASHELEIRWAELIKRLVPSAERVRFTASGTEATMMALRLARAFTGKDKVVRFLGHFHGWQDHLSFANRDIANATPGPGVLPGIADAILIAPTGDIDETRRIIESDDDVAAVILEPTGGFGGQLPLTREFVAELREITKARGVILIFDEVVTGFRVSKGGAQAALGVTPDLTALAKIMAGGLPGGAVVGKKEILDLLDFKETEARGVEKIGHQGTFNANPVSAAAGVAALEIIADTDACEHAARQAARLRDGFNHVFRENEIPWAAYGDCANFFVFTNPNGSGTLDPFDFDPFRVGHDRLGASSKHPAIGKLRLALFVHGVDISSKPGGVVSAAHSDVDIDDTVSGFREAVRMLRAEGEL